MVESTISFVQHFQVVRYVSVAGATILLHDNFLNIANEVRFIWNSSWGIGKALYLATRYLCYVDMAIIFIYLFYPQLDINSCKEVYDASEYPIVAGIVVAEIIMSMRTYALWGRSKRLLISLVVMLVPGTTIVIVFYFRRSNDIIWIPSPIPQLVACNAEVVDEVRGVMAFGLLMAYELVILLLTMWIGVKQWSEGQHRSPLTKQFYSDGVLYFFIMFAMSAANFTFRLVTAANADVNILLSICIIQRIFHSILSARMMVNLRQVANCEPEEPTAQLTAPDFAILSTNISSGQETMTTLREVEV